MNSKTKLKVNQNRGRFEHKGKIVETTMTKVIVHIGKGDMLIAGVKNSNDFDFETLYKLAIKKSKIEVA